jgi:hypothetical protein
MTPEEEQKYREQVRAELSKKNDEKVKAKIRKEEEAKADGGQLIHGAKEGLKMLFGESKKEKS